MKSSSMSDLMLKAHFNELKEELNKSLKYDASSSDNEIEKVLKDTFNYFKSKSIDSSLDDRGQKIYNEVARVLDDMKKAKMELPGKLPMQKAKGSGTTNLSQRKTGS